MRRSAVLAPATLLTLLAATAVSAPRSALAQSRASDVAAAQTLFDEARTLTKAGKYAEACPKFEESERLDAGPGTEFNLADCYDHAGRTASAWAEFAMVADSLRANGQRDREKFAREREASLEPRLTKLSINVGPAARVVGLEIKRDGEVLRDAQWGSGVPVDPGKHTLSATAPGKQPWQQTIDVTGEGKMITIDVPPLGAAASAAPPPPIASPSPAPASLPQPIESAPPAEKPSSSHGLGGQKIAALVAAGAGVVGLGIGGYFGATAMSKHNQYAPLCPGNVCATQAGVQLHDDAASDATISTIAMAVGAVAIAGGVVLWITAPRSSSEPSRTGVRLVPSVGARRGGLSLEGAW